MKTFDLSNDSGSLIGFQVSNFLLSRREAERLVGQIPGVTISRPVRRLFSSDPERDNFCVFRLGEVEFEIEEPFGDNSRYWIVGRPPEQSSELDLVREAFRNRRPFLAPSALIRFAVVALSIAALVRWLVLR